jgi:Tol biopolymer transport system component
MQAAPIDRRDFLQRTAILGTMLPLMGLPRPARAEPADLVARRVFFDNPDYGNVRVSPDGKHLAYVAPVDGVNNLWVADIADPAAARPVTRVTDRNIGSYFRWAYTNRHLVFFRERDGDENWRAASVDVADGAVVPLTPEQGVK